MQDDNKLKKDLSLLKEMLENKYQDEYQHRVSALTDAILLMQSIVNLNDSTLRSMVEEAQGKVVFRAGVDVTTHNVLHIAAWLMREVTYQAPYTEQQPPMEVELGKNQEKEEE